MSKSSKRGGNKVCLNIEIVPCSSPTNKSRPSSGKKQVTSSSRPNKTTLPPRKSYDELMTDVTDYEEMISGKPLTQHPMSPPNFTQQEQYLSQYLMPQTTTMKHAPTGNPLKNKTFTMAPNSSTKSPRGKSPRRRRPSKSPGSRTKSPRRRSKSAMKREN